MQVEKDIETLREAIVKTAKYTPKSDQDVSWPIGNHPPHKATNRFDVLRWTYFNMTHAFLDNDFNTVRELDTSEKEDITELVNKSIEKVLRESNELLKFTELVNGYWKFDASRGLDYILDLSFVSESGKNTDIRIEICKPLGKVEILPVPYVTENSRINMVLVIDSEKKEETLKFLAHYADTCMNKKDKISLTLVIMMQVNCC